MTVKHIITSMGLNWGGPALTTLLTVKGVRDIGVDASILTYGTEKNDCLVSDEPFINTLPPLSFWRKKMAYSGDMKQAVCKEKNDLYHIQGLWQYPGYIAACEAQKRNIPYLITLHGQLHPGALAYSSLSKKLALCLYQRRQLQQAACIQVTCMEEYRCYRALGFTNPVALVPNPVVCSSPVLDEQTDHVKRIGYLGRFHPCKKIDRLINAWAKLQEKDGILLIMGDGDKQYMSQLKKMVSDLKLTNVIFTGFVTGEKKQDLLASLSCLVVPSDFENFAMVVPEALLQHVPVIASKATPWEDLNTYQCGWWVDNDVATLTDTIRKAFSIDEQIRQDMGMRGAELVRRKYSLEAVSLQMKQVYEWVTGQASKPDFVYTD